MRKLGFLIVVAALISVSCGSDETTGEYNFSSSVCRLTSIEETKQTSVEFVDTALFTLEHRTDEGIFNGNNALNNFWFACAKAGVVINDTTKPRKLQVDLWIRESNRAHADHILSRLRNGEVNNITYEDRSLRREYRESIIISRHIVNEDFYWRCQEHLDLELAIAEVGLQYASIKFSEYAAQENWERPIHNVVNMFDWMDTSSFSLDELGLRQTYDSMLVYATEIEIKPKIDIFVTNVVSNGVFKFNPVKSLFSDYKKRGGTKTLAYFGLPPERIEGLRLWPYRMKAVEHLSNAYAACSPGDSDCDRVVEEMHEAEIYADSAQVSLALISDSTGIPQMYLTWMQQTAGQEISYPEYLATIESVDYFPCNE